ncbi:carboxylesterase [Scopulibacillus darangshiensis]|uniref:Carboxylesterase n=1 Tax=Scopulibacillus darangshiensis TaxID=442528 RepID=A0A4R2NJL8_9BACL|nr:alpha/beta fold hydrolase [Scopulibacillus darangshiensis]TCP21508.1 carboxylesterase [Scopulibacillus darangshiensis]
MKVVAPKPFMYKAGEKAVLLLHGFTGNTADVRKLGRYLQKGGYTCYGPVYAGHGLDPAKLKETSPADWWQSALDGYNHLIKEGYNQIAVVGVSLGAEFSLRLGATYPVKAIVSMSAPVKGKSSEKLYERVLDYAYNIKKMQGIKAPQIEHEMEAFREEPMESLEDLRSMIDDIRELVPKIEVPIFVMVGAKDDELYRESALYIHHHVRSKNKQFKTYENSGHIITLDQDAEKVYNDVLQFFESLSWS